MVVGSDFPNRHLWYTAALQDQTSCLRAAPDLSLSSFGREGQGSSISRESIHRVFGMNNVLWNDEWNTKYTSLRRDTPSGSILRRFWHPILLSSDLPTRSIRSAQVLGEDIVLFRLADGRIGVLPAHCPHRGASLQYGHIEQEGIRCAYHGWKFSCSGEFLEAPFGKHHVETGAEASVAWAGRTFECGGIIFVCFKPTEDESSLPRWDILLTGSDEVVVQRHEVPCNWFQYQENAADLTHTLFLHGAWMKALGIPDASGFYAPLNWYAFARQPFGIVKAWRYEDHEVGWGNVAVFPNMLRIVQEMHWRVPLSEERTLIFQVSGRRLNAGPRFRQSLVPNLTLPAVNAEAPPVYGAQESDKDRQFRLWSFQGQDAAVCVTQGPTVDRTRERLVTSDYGVCIYRRAWQEFCDGQAEPSEAYAQIRGTDGTLDLRPWLGGGHVTVSRPVEDGHPMPGRAWFDIFRGNEYLVTVPRGTAGRGPLG